MTGESNAVNVTQLTQATEVSIAGATANAATEGTGFMVIYTI